MRDSAFAAVALLLAACNSVQLPPHETIASANGYATTGRTIRWGDTPDVLYIEPGLSDEVASGQYRRTLDITHGITVFLFPDHDYLTLLFCDICEPEVFTRGTWLLEGNRVILSETFRKTSPEIPVWEEIAGVKAFQLVATLKHGNPDSRIIIPSARWDNVSGRPEIGIVHAWIHEALDRDWQDTRKWILEHARGFASESSKN